MAETTLIQEQGHLIRRFHGAITQQEKSIADAEAQLRKDEETALAQRKNEQVEVDELKNKVKEAYAKGVEILKGRGRANALTGLPPMRGQTVVAGQRARSLLQACVQTATNSVAGIQNSSPISRGGKIVRGLFLFSLIYLALVYVVGGFGFVGFIWNYIIPPTAIPYLIGDIPYVLGSGYLGQFLLAVGISFGIPLGLTLMILRPWRGGRVKPHCVALAQAVADAEQLHKQASSEISVQYEKQIAVARAKHESHVTKAKGEAAPRVEQAKNEATEITTRIEAISPVWGDAKWNTWAPSSSQASLCLLGAVTTKTERNKLSMPVVYPFPGNNALLVEATGTAKSQATKAIQSLLLRMLSSIPPGKLRFTFVDPIGLGQNIASFMHLVDYDEALVTNKAWTEPQHIEQRLADLTEHMENVIQKYLRNQYATIEDYNAHAGEIAEPYRVLVVFDFPTNFSETAARRLVSIAQNGPRCGVYAVVLADSEQSLPHGFNITDLERASQVIAWSGEGFVWKDEQLKDCIVTLDTPPSGELFDRIIKAVGEASKSASKVEVPFERIAPIAEKWWAENSSTGLVAALGPSGARKVQMMELGKGTAQHTLVAGKTGSGKSTLLHTLITSLALTYSPEELELYLIDFKQGIEFKTYAERHLPHARVIAIESEREFGLSVLQGLDAEIKRRGELFRATTQQTGTKVENIANFRSATGQKLPRILLLVDEFQEFFTEDDTTASQAAQILDRLVRQGRAFGIHVLLGSQTLAGAYTLARSTIDQMAVRIALQCSEADSRLILADDNPAARLLSRPGEAIYNAANGMVEGNNRFQVAWLPDEQRDKYLEQVLDLAEKHEYRPTRPQIVFEGNAPARIDDQEKNRNHPLYNLLAGLDAQATPIKAPRAWLGEPIAIREPVAATFRRQSGSNLLIVGQNDEASLGMMTTSIVSLASQVTAPQSVSGNGAAIKGHFYLLDFGAVDGPYAEFFDKLAEHVPSLKIGRRRHLPDMINSIATEVQRRMDHEEGSSAPIYLLVYGLHRARDLRQEESFGFSSFSDEPAPPSPAQQFTTILREGPDVGVHTLAWCDTVTNLNRSLDRRALREFAMRVAFQMSAEDSSNLVDTPISSKLGQHRALFYSEDEGRMEKFRPYAPPSEEWLRWVGQQLQVRSVAPVS